MTNATADLIAKTIEQARLCDNSTRWSDILKRVDVLIDLYIKERLQNEQ
jgi:hypothetical protein